MSVKRIIIDTLRVNELNSFTLDELRILLTAQGVTENSVNINKGLYKNIWNLKKSGMLELVKAKDPKENVYIVTSLLKDQYLQPSEKNNSISPQADLMPFLEVLKVRLNSYSSELATTSAAIQEYQEHLSEFSVHGSKLNRGYQVLQERAFQLRGRLFAVESIMKSLQQ